jgi:hypothetical protein
MEVRLLAPELLEANMASQHFLRSSSFDRAEVGKQAAARQRE